ncbi:hypothetical protein J5U23_02906 [Saccharolobus shibatae B12]|uniref:Uncharacterized protein n=1 Tax=Saccharolobus shibatae (strain ATCC 51178 / DSM 5389 / JCM 8931 / NBRC 15437 / B12) TaxID=523848 RepID=A0A8F5GV39_SACSH|nr:hypothetical protein [Saccharolobus shibatae]QXJ27124.1 hypothetical protein J5U23_p2906 [Saccharolobus shibatae B12]QXJ30017.1 hypothetical protein J5U23_02906 [Saccharolobus shibatae B12]
MLRKLVQIGKKMRKNGMHETTWYTFGAAAGAAIVGNTILSNVNVAGLNAATVTDIIGGGLAAAGFYELTNIVTPKIVLWLEKRKAKQ